MPLKKRRSMIEVPREALSLTRQCDLLSLSRSGYYYKAAEESALNLELMSLMDEHYLKHPYKGARRMHVWLTKDNGYEVSLNRVSRLYYRVMGLRAIFPGPHTSKRAKNHPVYPYLLGELKIEYPNQVWATDITYIPMASGYMYLTAIIDLYSRYILHWSLSNTMEAQWCADCFLEAIAYHGCPEIINTDQGSQYTSEVFTQSVLAQGVKLSMDGKGRATDNAYIETFWKTIKYEDIYLWVYEDGFSLHQGISAYIEKYNTMRRHSSIDNAFPLAYYTESVSSKKIVK